MKLFSINKFNVLTVLYIGHVSLASAGRYGLSFQRTMNMKISKVVPCERLLFFKIPCVFSVSEKHTNTHVHTLCNAVDRRPTKLVPPDVSLKSAFFFFLTRRYTIYYHIVHGFRSFYTVHVSRQTAAVWIAPFRCIFNFFLTITILSFVDNFKRQYVHITSFINDLNNYVRQWSRFVYECDDVVAVLFPIPRKNEKKILQTNKHVFRLHSGAIE